MPSPLSAQLLAFSAGILLAVGCTSKSSARKDAMLAFQAGQQQGGQQSEQQRNSLMVRGSVRNQVIRWQPGLTLSQAIIAAEYLGRTDPHRITVSRAGVSYPIDVRRLLRGQEDPELHPGDLVDVQ